VNNCLIIAGEKSGEEHTLSFLPSLMNNAKDYSFWGVGGDEMKSAGVELVYHLKDFSSWGFSEVITKIPFYKKALNDIVDEVIKRNCKVAILVDFQGFNMRLAKRLKPLGVKVLYYVAPQAWVWKEGRVKALRQNVETLFTILPFEKKWFLDRGVKQVVSVSHPLWLHYNKICDKDNYGAVFKNFDWLQNNLNILLLPGSRNFEVKNLLPKFIKAAKSLPFKVNIGLVESSNVNRSLFEPYRSDIDKFFDHEKLEDAYSWAGVCLAASGTVTLTCSLFQIPTIMAYKSSLLNEFIFYTLLDYKGHISLANIVHEKEVFPELIQNRASSYNMKRELMALLTDKEKYDSVKADIAHTKDLLRGEIDDPAVKMLESFTLESQSDH
jgi:lipid-A-disaccharide synthase